MRVGLVCFAVVFRLNAAAPKELHVEQNRLVENGQTVRMEGLNVPSLEWSNTGEYAFRSCRVATEDWNANWIRLPVSQDRWFGKADGQKDKGEAYRDSIDDIVAMVTRRNAYVTIDLHWSDAGVWGKNIGQHKMPDANSVIFWKEVARHFRKEPHVLFGIYNEPHDVGWDVWRNGGLVDEGDLKYQAIGMQELVDTIRKAGAPNVIVAGGLDWAYDLTGIVNGSPLQDPSGRGIAYDAHIYPWKKDWDAKVGATADRYPVVVGEAGCEPDPKQEAPETWAPKLISWMDQRNLSWTAWSFHPAAKPCVILDWTYAPTPYWGQFVKQALAKRS